MKIANILVVEDQENVRKWIVDFVSELFPKARFLQAATLQQARGKLDPLPDLLMIDLSLPDGRGHELIPLVKRQQAETPCVVITNFEDDDFLFPALKAGADGYLLKDHTAAELKTLLSRIVEGKPPLSPLIADKLFNYFRQASQEIPTLSPRELETLQLIAKGYAVKECARLMSISPYTVEGHIKEIYRKLQVKTRAEAVAKAVQLGFYR